MEVDIVKSAEIQNYLQKIRSSTNTAGADDYLNNKKADLSHNPFTISTSLLFKVQSLYGEGDTYYVEGIILEEKETEIVRDVHGWIEYKGQIIDAAKSLNNVPVSYQSIIKADTDVLNHMLLNRLHKPTIPQNGNHIEIIPLFTHFRSFNEKMSKALNRKQAVEIKDSPTIQQLLAE